MTDLILGTLLLVAVGAQVVVVLAVIDEKRKTDRTSVDHSGGR